MRPLLILFLGGLIMSVNAVAASDKTHDDLLTLFEEWRDFERPPLLAGAPDYRQATNDRRHKDLANWQQRLHAFDISEWTIPQRVDWHLLRAEMNGMDFNYRVLRPWQRDPAFYASVWTFKSDTPAHEGPTHHAIIELWSYDFPLDTAAEQRLSAQLATIAPLLTQARDNLTGNARDLWIGGIENLRDQAAALTRLQADTPKLTDTFRTNLTEATEATRSFVSWLEAEARNKTGPSGIGVENYNWQLQHVHLIPMTWEDEVRLLKRELDRALSSLKLEEHRNRKLPPLTPIASEQEYVQRAAAAIDEFHRFLVQEEILPPYDYLRPALVAQQGAFVPADQRNFFATVSHHEQKVLWAHWYHWFDLGRLETRPNPNPIRQGPLLYNIWDSRSEGMSTGFEEMTMHAGLYENNPRARELVWIMLAQRAARGLGSLYAHANRFTLQEARDFHVEWTPRGWMREDLDLLGFEQLLYLRQPGYGTSYVTGKYLIERLLGEYGKTRGDDFKLMEFFSAVDQIGVIPVSMIRWEMLGKGDEIDALVNR